MRCPECGSDRQDEKFIIWRPITGDKVCDSRFHDDDYDFDGDEPESLSHDDRPDRADDD